MIPTIETTLRAVNAPARVIGSTAGPRFTRAIVVPEPGTRVGRIMRAGPDLAVALGVESVRMDATADGIAIEIPRDDVQPVPLAAIMSEADWPDSPIAFAIGRDVAGSVIVADLARMPHLLIAGATGTGKSVALNVLLVSMLARSGPGALRLLLVDAKRVELAPYSGLPHLVGPIVTEPEEAALALSGMVARMEQRYALLAKHGVRSVADLPRRVARYVVVVDELADLVMSNKDVRDHLVRLAQKSRAAGIHLVLATQRPSTDVITGLLKANVPGRMALAVTSNVDSRVILDMAGAEDLLGRGDMLFKPPWLLEPIRVQGAMVTDEEVRAVVARYASVALETTSVPATTSDHAQDIRLALYGLAALVIGLAAWMIGGMR